MSGSVSMMLHGGRCCMGDTLVLAVCSAACMHGRPHGRRQWRVRPAPGTPAGGSQYKVRGCDTPIRAVSKKCTHPAHSKPGGALAPSQMPPHT